MAFANSFRCSTLSAFCDNYILFLPEERDVVFDIEPSAHKHPSQ